jgi:hypothetical protein
MSVVSSTGLLNALSTFDPSPLYGLSLIPYLAFLWWGQKCRAMPRVALWGFRMTLVFVLITVIFAIIASQRYGRELADVDFLHGAAEAFLTLSDALVVLGFALVQQKRVVKNS